MRPVDDPTPPSKAQTSDGPTDTDADEHLLIVSGASKSFGGVAALRDVSLTCRRSEIVGLIGPNGAGKTTLINVISGVMRPESGEITLNGKRLDRATPRDSARAGIGRTFQNIRLFGRLTVRQNIEVSAAVRRRHRARLQTLDIDELLRILELDEVVDRKPGTLAYGLQRRTEIARALALAPEFLLLDEPAAGMNVAESAQLSDAIRGIRAAVGCGILVIDHDLRFIMGLCERIYVLHQGQVLCHGEPAAVQANPEVKTVYLGSRRRREVGN